MTLNEFLAALEKTPRDWRSDKYGHLRRKNGFECPVSTLAGMYACSYLTAADRIGLPAILATQIAEAADYQKPSEIRNKLLKACGLEGK